MQYLFRLAALWEVAYSSDKNSYKLKKCFTLMSFRSFTVLFVLAVFVGFQFSLEAQAQQKPPQKKIRVVKVETAPVARRSINTVVEAVGTSKANRSVSVMAISNGVVREITFQDGQLVKAGDVLVRLDDDIQRADLAEAQARLKEAEQSLKRSQSLRKRDAVAVSSVEKQIAEVIIAKAERERAARRLRDRTLKAPFGGRIGFSDIEIGSHLKTDEEVAVLDDLSQIKVEFYLPETLFAKVSLGTPILADAAAFDAKAFNGEIEAIDTRINATSRSFKVRAVITNEDGLLPAGMFLHLSLIMDATEALSVPEESVMVDGAQTSVFVAEADGEQMVVHKRTVKLGRRAFGWLEILEGVQEGELVVTRGIQKIRDGSFVKINRGEKAKQVQG